MPEDDVWAEAWSRLNSALEHAHEAGMTDDEIEECVWNARPSEEVHVGGGPKRPKKKG